MGHFSMLDRAVQRSSARSVWDSAVRPTGAAGRVVWLCGSVLDPLNARTARYFEYFVMKMVI